MMVIQHANQTEHQLIKVEAETTISKVMPLIMSRSASICSIKCMPMQEKKAHVHKDLLTFI